MYLASAKILYRTRSCRDVISQVWSRPPYASFLERWKVAKNSLVAMLCSDYFTYIAFVLVFVSVPSQFLRLGSSIRSLSLLYISLATFPPSFWGVLLCPPLQPVCRLLRRRWEDILHTTHTVETTSYSATFVLVFIFHIHCHELWLWSRRQYSSLRYRLPLKPPLLIAFFFSIFSPPWSWSVRCSYMLWW